MEQVELSKEITQAEPQTNPKEFFSNFCGSKEYGQAYDQFFTGKNLAPSVTDEQKKKAFEGQEAARLAFLGYARKNPFKFDPAAYSETTLDAVHKYIEAAVKLKDAKALKTSQDDIVNADSERTGAHAKLANLFAEERIVTNQNLGKVLATALLVGEKLDTISTSPPTQLQRIQNIAR